MSKLWYYCYCKSQWGRHTGGSCSGWCSFNNRPTYTSTCTRLLCL